MAEVTREIESAHYLHERTGLEPVVRPPVPEPTCLAWRPRSEQCLAGNRLGEIFEIDPIMGTTRRAHGLGWLTSIAVHPDNRRFVALSADGSFAIGEIGDADLLRGEHGFSRRMSAFWLGEYAILVGDAASGRSVLIVHNGKVVRRIPVPHRAVARVGPDGKLQLVRSTPQGLVQQTLTAKPVPVDAESTAHVLRVLPHGVIGYTVLGLVVWGERHTVSLRLADLGVAALSPDGERVAMGTRSGAVALASLETPESRARPDIVAAFEGPVKAVEFSERGRWLATAGDALVVWTWER